jgi:hypothetical protein
VTGSQHVAKGLGCDDAYGYGIAGDFLVAVVADGAGSVSGTSAWGSYTACQSVLRDAMDPGFIADVQAAIPERAPALMRWLFESALDRITYQADVMGLPATRLSTTLAVALADRDKVVFGQIGDGVIASEHDGRIGTLLIEAKDEYANTTWFVQSAGAFEESFRTTVQLGTQAIGLSTDGMVYKITNVLTGEAFEPFFKRSWDHVRSGVSSADFAALLRGIQDDQTGDDKTMVLAALSWEDDQFHPSARPTRTITISSPPPPTPVSDGAPKAAAEENHVSAEAPVINSSRRDGMRRHSGDSARTRPT